MKKNTKIITRVLSCVICLALFSSTMVFADDQTTKTKDTTKDETVYVMQNPDGSIKNEIVSNWVHSDNGINSINEKLDLTNIKNVKSDKKPTIKDGVISWDMSDNDVYYQGNTTKTPPITMNISYKLDGKEITPANLAGKSGKVEIHIKYKNNQKSSAMINGKSRELYTPMLVATVCNLNTDIFTNVKCENAKIISDANNQVLMLLAVPGLKESLGSSYDSIKGATGIELLDEYTITCDAKEFKLSSIISAVTNDLPLDNIKEAKNLDQLADAISVMKDVQDATLQLANGSTKLAEAMHTFSSKMNELETNYKTFSNGVNDLNKGSSDLNDGAIKLADGIAQYTKAINDMFNTISIKLPDAEGKLLSAKADASKGLQIIGKDMVLASDQMAKIALNTQNVGAQIQSIQPIIMSIMQNPNIDPTTKAELVNSLKATMVNSGQALNGLAQELQTHGATLKEMGGVMQNMQKTTEKMTKDLDKEFSEMKKKLVDANYQLHEKSELLNDGAKKVKDGVGALKDGTNKLKDGSDKLSSGIGQLNSGSKTLSEKTSELSGGMNEFNDKLNDALNNKDIDMKADDIKTLFEVKDKLVDMSKEYTTFTGKPDESESSVKFIMKTSEIKMDKTIPTNATVQKTVVEKVGFFGKIANFFKGLFHKG